MIDGWTSFEFQEFQRPYPVLNIPEPHIATLRRGVSGYNVVPAEFDYIILKENDFEFSITQGQVNDGDFVSTGQDIVITRYSVYGVFLLDSLNLDDILDHVCLPYDPLFQDDEGIFVGLATEDCGAVLVMTDEDGAIVPFIC